MKRAYAGIMVTLLLALGSRVALAEKISVDRSRGTVRRVWADPGANSLGAPSLDGRYLSCVDPETGDLALLDLTTGDKRRLTNKGARQDSGEFAYFSTISPDGRQVAYAWFNGEKFYDLRVVGLDGAKPRILYRNEEAGFVQPSAWSPDGKQILTLFFRKDNISQIALVSVLDGSVRVLKSLNWVYPKKMDFSPDGRYIVYDSFASEGSAQRDIFVLSVDGSRETVLVEHPADDLFPVWAPDGKRILFASDRTGTMDAWVIPVAEGRPQGPPELVQQGMGRFLPMGITRKGAYYYGLRVGMTDVYIASFDPVTGKLLGSPTPASRRLPGGNSSPEWSPDGQQLAYFSRRGSENFGQAARVISIRWLKTGQNRELSPKLAHIERLHWSPDGRFLLVGGSDRKSRGGLYQVDAQTAEVVPIVQDDSATFRGLEGVWAADGKAIFYVHEDGSRSSEIRFRDLETGREQKLYRPVPPSRIRYLARSPDGRRLAFGSSSGDYAQEEALLVIPSGGGETREVLRMQKGGLSGVEWTPDGRQLFFSRAGDSAPELWRIPLEGGQPQKLELSTDWQGDVSLHPAGRRIAFTAGKNRSEVWVMENFLPELQAGR